MSDALDTVLARANALKEQLAGNEQDTTRLFGPTFAAAAPDYVVPGLSVLLSARSALVAELQTLERLARREGATVGGGAVPRFADFVGALFRPAEALGPDEEWATVRLRVPLGT